MANPTTNYGFVLPTATDLVTDLPADFDVALQGVDTRIKALQPGTTLGDLVYSSATANTNTRLGVGTNGQVLAVSGGVPAWTTTSDVTPLTTKGDLFTFTTVDARIGVGANGTVLTADSAEATGLKWVTPAGGGKVLQVVSTAKTDEFTTTSTSFVDVTGLSVSITPSSATSKILITATYQDTVTTDQTGFARLMRGSTAIAVGAASGNRTQCTTVARGLADNELQTHSIMFLDSPATTSATTYKMQAMVENVALTTYYLNRAVSNIDNAARGVTASTITVMEIGA